jgi:Cdc6-like AAA superfamily ATPase
MGHRDFDTKSLFGNETAHLPEQLSPQQQREQALSGTPEERAEFTRNVAVHVEHYRVGLQTCASLIKRAGRTNRPGGLWIYGDGGSGKSFLLNSVVKAHPPHESGAGPIFPVLMISIPGRVSESTLLAMLLLQMGCDILFIANQSNNELEETLVNALKASGVRAIIFDEAHHLWGVNSSSKKTASALGGVVGNTLKRIYDLSGVAFIFSGINQLKRIVDADPQLFTRWAGSRLLTPFEDDASFRGILTALDEALPMPQPANLSSKKIASQIHEACQGHFRTLKSLLAEVVYLASVENSPSITREHFRRCYIDIYCSETTPFDK